MGKLTKIKDLTIIDLLESLSPEEIQANNNRQREENSRVYEEFKSSFQRGECYICKSPLNFFIEGEPCFHWFLIPDGIKKKHFTDYLSNEFKLFNFDAYLRWVANLEVPLKNINDIKDDLSENKVIEYTIRYKNIEWSVNMNANDLLGHQKTSSSYFPHFHLQVLVDGRPFIRFNDFHIPLNRFDVELIIAMVNRPDLIMCRNTYGLGMSVLDDKEEMEQLIDVWSASENEEEGTFNVSFIAEFPEDVNLTAERLEQLEQESRDTGRPLSNIIELYYPEAKTVRLIRPGRGLVNKSKRQSRSNG